MRLKHKLNCNTIGCKMGYAVKGIKRLLKERFEEYEIKLTLEQYYVLNILNNEEKLILQELADIMDRDKSAVLRLLKGLKENHFIARTVDSKDKRKKNLFITKPGIEELSKARTLEQEVSDKITESIPQKKLQEFEGILSTIYKTAISC